MNKKQIVVHHGQKVIATDGKTHTVAVIVGEAVYAYGLYGFLYRIIVVSDAWGGEHDQTMGLAA